MRHRLLLFVHILAVLSIAPAARAQSSAEDHAAADALYEEAGNLMKAGRFVDACPKLEASQRLDPGIGTTMRLGYCYEHVGRTASAWQAWKTTLTVAAQPGTQTVAVPALAAAPVGQDMGSKARPFWGGQRIAGVAVGGAGVLGLVLGAVFGGKTLGKTSDAKAHCSATMPFCDATGLQLQRDAATTAKVADAALIVGGAAVVGGVVLFLTTPSAGAKAAGSVWLRPTAGLDRAGLSLETEW
jgi:hypothetical protein